MSTRNGDGMCAMTMVANQQPFPSYLINNPIKISVVFRLQSEPVNCGLFSHSLEPCKYNCKNQKQLYTNPIMNILLEAQHRSVIFVCE